MKRDTWTKEVRFLATSLVMLAAGTALAGWEGSWTPYIYTTSFGSYAIGEALSDKGADGGSWGDVAAHASAAAETNTTVEAMCMAMSSDSHGLPFTVTNKGVEGPKNVYVKLSPGSISKLPNFQPNTVKAAFFVHQPYDSETPTFQGWSADGWKTLSAEGITCSTNAWYDVSIWVVKTYQNKIQVQYRLLRPVAAPVVSEEEEETQGVAEPQYAALADENGVTWFDAGIQDDAFVSSVSLRGAGSFQRVTGKELPSPGISVSFQ